MKILRLIPCLAALGAPIIACGADQVEAAKPNVSTDGEIRVLPRSRADRLYQLFIGLPASYAKEPQRKYPVVFVVDGNWNFASVRSYYWGLAYDKTIPEAILVAVGYAGENLDFEQLRGDDLAPPLRTRTMFFDGQYVGHADEFLKVIETQAIPLLEHDYRADPRHRVLMGGSLGGLFALYTLYTRPELFQGYVAASPSVQTLWQYEEDFARSGRSFQGRLFASIGGQESKTYQNEVELLQRRISARNYIKGGYRFRRYESLRHGGAISAAFLEGMQYALEPLAPERGIAPELDAMFERGFFEIHFNRTAALPREANWNAAQSMAMKQHRQILDDLVRDKKIIAASRTADGDEHTFSTVGISAKALADAEALAAADPAVKAGLLSFEIVDPNAKLAP